MGAMTANIMIIMIMGIIMLKIDEKSLVCAGR